MKNNTALWWISGVLGLTWLANKKGLSSIGKLSDTYDLKPGGRVDRHWRLPEIETRYLGRRADSEKNLKHYNIPEKALEHFGLHAIEFGNWMNQKDRANFMFATLVSLADMAKVLNTSQGNMGFNNGLSLAFGARGMGGFAAAFYQSPIGVINLTKTNGKGTFSHEYGHALDEYLNQKHNNQNGFISGGRSTRHTTDLARFASGSVEYYFEKMFDAILWENDGTPSSYKEFLNDMNSQYLNRRAEIWARVFEGYIEIKFKEKGIRNSWAIIRGQSDIPEKKLIKKAQPYIQRIVRAAF